jgi:hypothetical protein
MIVGALTTCHTQYTWDRSICIFLFIRTTTVPESVVQVDVSSIDCLSLIKNDAIARSFKFDIRFLRGPTLFMTVLTVYAELFGRAV